MCIKITFDPMDTFSLFTPLDRSDWLFVSVLNPGCVPGDEVSCELCLNLADPLTFDSITLHLEGDEKTGIKNTSVDKYQQHFQHFTFEREKVLSMSCVIATSGTLDAGQFKFVSKFKLPLHIAPTFLHTTPNTFHRIRYSLVGVVKASGMPPFKAKFPVYIYPARPTDDRPLAVRETRDVNRMCSSADMHNSIMFAVRAPSSHFNPAEPLNFAIDVCNDTNHEMSVHVSLHQMTNVQTARENFSHPDELGRCQLVSVQAHEAYQGRLVKFTLAPSLCNEPTLQTDNATCEYTLNIVAQRPCSKPVSMNIPVALLPSCPLSSSEWLTSLSQRYPPGWAPAQVRPAGTPTIHELSKSVSSSLGKDSGRKSSSSSVVQPSKKKSPQKKGKNGGRVSTVIPAVAALSAQIDD